MAGEQGAGSALEILKKFCEKGDLRSAVDGHGWTPLHVVCYLQFPGALECLDLLRKLPPIYADLGVHCFREGELQISAGSLSIPLGVLRGWKH